MLCAELISSNSSNRPRSSMERCSHEVLWMIFEPICDDGGDMGKSLALVSRHIHNASIRVRFQSAKCHGPSGVAALLSLLNKTPPELRIIRHLYVFHSALQSPVLPPKATTPPSLTDRALVIPNNAFSLLTSPIFSQNTKETIQGTATRTLPSPSRTSLHRRSTSSNTSPWSRSYNVLGRSSLSSDLPSPRGAHYKPLVCRRMSSQ